MSLFPFLPSLFKTPCYFETLPKNAIPFYSVIIIVIWQQNNQYFLLYETLTTGPIHGAYEWGPTTLHVTAKGKIYGMDFPVIAV